MISTILSKRLERSPRNVMKVLAAVEDVRKAANDYTNCVDGIDGDERSKSKVRCIVDTQKHAFDDIEWTIKSGNVINRDTDGVKGIRSTASHISEQVWMFCEKHRANADDHLNEISQRYIDASTAVCDAANRYIASFD